MAESDAPRWLSRKTLAAYISIRPSGVSRLVDEGRLPKPSLALGPRSPRWDRLAVDEAFLGESDRAEADAAIAAAVADILREGSKRRRKASR